jgi:sulfate adenylyltransferase
VPAVTDSGPVTSTVIEVHPSARALGDAVLLAQGAYAPLDRFVCAEEGRRIRDRGQLVDGAAFPVPVTLVLSEDETRDVSEGDTLVLVDAEGAAVAEVAVDNLWDAGQHQVGVSGFVRGSHAPPHSFAALALTAHDVREQFEAADARGLLLERPLMAPEVSALAEIAEDGPVVLLVRTVDPLVPADVLVKATLAAASSLPNAHVVTVPFGRRHDPADDTALGDIVMRNYGVRPVDVMLGTAGWAAAADTLAGDDDTALGEAFDPATLAVLRRWRPPRRERGLVVFFTGLSGSGKSTVARGLVDRLHETDRSLTVLDGDVARRMLSSGLGFSRADRDTNIRRLGWVGSEVARHGGLAVLAPIAPFAATRAEVRRMVEANGDLVLVWVSTPLEECERRDRKGLYAKARRGEIPDFTGISSPYEAPDDADLVLDTTHVSVDDAVEQVWDYLVDGGWISGRPADGAT